MKCDWARLSIVRRQRGFPTGSRSESHRHFLLGHHFLGSEILMSCKQILSLNFRSCARTLGDAELLGFLLDIDGDRWIE